MNSSAAAFLFFLAVMYFGHQLADHWVQTEKQAEDKGERNIHGALACLRHVLALTATQTVFLAVAAWRTDMPLELWPTAAALAFNAASHWIIDLRWTLARLAKICRKDVLYFKVPGGRYMLDQSAHIFMIFIAALIAA